jgi:hypothetical protein
VGLQSVHTLIQGRHRRRDELVLPAEERKLRIVERGEREEQLGQCFGNPRVGHDDAMTMLSIGAPYSGSCAVNSVSMPIARGEPWSTAALASAGASRSQLAPLQVLHPTKC